jgi:hypothetical protein
MNCSSKSPGLTEDRFERRESLEKWKSGIAARSTA